MNMSLEKNWPIFLLVWAGLLIGFFYLILIPGGGKAGKFKGGGKKSGNSGRYFREESEKFRRTGEEVDRAPLSCFTS